MRAAVYKGGQQFAVEDLPDPTPGPGQVVIDVNYCAICGTDVSPFPVRHRSSRHRDGSRVLGHCQQCGRGSLPLEYRRPCGRRWWGTAARSPRRKPQPRREIQLPARRFLRPRLRAFGLTLRRSCWKSGNLSRFQKV